MSTDIPLEYGGATIHMQQLKIQETDVISISCVPYPAGTVRASLLSRTHGDLCSVRLQITLEFLMVSMGEG